VNDDLRMPSDERKVMNGEHEDNERTDPGRAVGIAGDAAEGSSIHKS
jgi:hypothetical protein